MNGREDEKSALMGGSRKGSKSNPETYIIERSVDFWEDEERSGQSLRWRRSFGRGRVLVPLKSEETCLDVSGVPESLLNTMKSKRDDNQTFEGSRPGRRRSQG